MSQKLAVHRKSGEQDTALWWKPVFDMQKEMTRNFQHLTPGLIPTPLSGILPTPLLWGGETEMFDNWQKNVHRLFSEMFNNRQMLTPWWVGSATEPYVDIIENSNHFTIRADVPGVDTEDLDISASDSALTIRGFRKELMDEKDERTLHRECHTGDFSRTIALPEEADLDKAEVTFLRNVLTIRVPKKEDQVRSRKPRASEESGKRKAA